MIVIENLNFKESRLFVEEARASGQNPTVLKLEDYAREYPDAYMGIRTYPTIIVPYDAYWDETEPIYDPEWEYSEEHPEPTIIGYGKDIPAGLKILEVGMEVTIEGQTFTIVDYGDCLKYNDYAIIRADQHPPHGDE